jgi:hypothetical protein
MVSDEVDNFKRVITIDSDATFLDLHNAILKATNYKKDQITSFFICSDDWEKETEVTLIEMDTTSEFDNSVMEDTILNDLLTDEQQKLLYVFDMMNERAFFIELSEIVTSKSQAKAECVLSKGNPPKQIIENFNPLIISTSSGIDENFYGDTDYDEDELDEESFGDMDFDNSSLFSDGERY